MLLLRTSIFEVKPSTRLPPTSADPAPEGPARDFLTASVFSVIVEPGSSAEGGLRRVLVVMVMA